jgi:hypothetical protein
MSQVITKKEKGDNLVQNIINNFYYSVKGKR